MKIRPLLEPHANQNAPDFITSLARDAIACTEGSACWSWDASFEYYDANDEESPHWEVCCWTIPEWVEGHDEPSVGDFTLDLEALRSLFDEIADFTVDPDGNVHIAGLIDTADVTLCIAPRPHVAEALLGGFFHWMHPHLADIEAAIDCARDDYGPEPDRSLN